VVGIKHNNRKENTNRRRYWPEDVVDDTSTNVGRHSGRPNYAGPEDVTRDHCCAHLAPSVTPLARTSRLMHHRRYSHADGRRLLACLGSAASLGPRGRRRLPAQGHRCRSPSGLGSHRHRLENRRHYSGSRNLHHRTSRSWSCGHRLGVHRRARSGATAVVANKSGWSVKN
jgi:hypothetical protein